VSAALVFLGLAGVMTASLSLALRRERRRDRGAGLLRDTPPP
jgi:hypothetical protein